MLFSMKIVGCAKDWVTTCVCFHVYNQFRPSMGRSYIWGPILFPDYFIVISIEVFVHFNEFRTEAIVWSPAVGVGAGITSRTRSAILDHTGCRVARIEVFAETINTWCWTNSGCCSEASSAGCDLLSLVGNGNRGAGIAADECGDSRGRKNRGGRTCADLCNLDDMDSFRHDISLSQTGARQGRKSQKGKSEKHCGLKNGRVANPTRPLSTTS
jgi:hypothetical protein